MTCQMATLVKIIDAPKWMISICKFVFFSWGVKVTLILMAKWQEFV